MSACPDDEVVLAFLDGRLDDTARSQVEDHVDACVACRALLAAAATTNDAPSQVSPTAATARFGPPVAAWAAGVAPQESAPLLPIDGLVAHFRISRLIGRGGMGEVYLARDTRLGRRVALKAVGKDVLRVAPDAFRREAEATARFNHPHIVTIYDVGEHQGVPWVALEYLEGESLRARLRRRMPGATEALRIALSIADALAAAHRAGVVHRDLKPENVFLANDGRLRVLDFGIARLIGVDVETTAHGKASGTPAYMAPEQWRGDGELPPVDVWALGVVLYETFTGRRPFPGKSREELRARVTSSDPAPFDDVRELFPPAIAGCVERCLAKDPTRRPTADEVLTALRSALGDVQAIGGAAPFRGLLPFDEEHAALFFGREREIEAFLARFDNEALLPVVGPSGRGKSSFVHAGVLPRLREREPLAVLRMRPGAQPLRALAAVCAVDLDDKDDVAGVDPARVLAERPGILGLWLLERARAAKVRVVLVVDQLEEVFTTCDDATARLAFVRAIAGAAVDPLDPVRVLFTLRDDFLGRLADGLGSAGALAQVTALRALDEDARVEALVRPLSSVGFAFDDDATPRRMVRDAGAGPSALPLLQFAAERLWERRDVDAHRLRARDYEAFGGIEGALAAHADSFLAGLTDDDTATLRRLLLRLVTDEDTRRTRSERDLLDDLGPAGARLVKALVAARLVTSSRAASADPKGSPEDGVVVELSHESLIKSWPRLRRWVEDAHEELAVAREIDEAAALWARRGRRTEELWQGAALDDVLRRLHGQRAHLGADARAFLDEAERRGDAAHRRRTRTRLALGALLVVATFVSTALAAEFARRGEAARTAHREALVAQAASELERGEAGRARALVRAALESGESRAARALWWSLLSEPVLARSPVGAWDTAFDATGEHLAVAAQTSMILVDTATQQVVRRFTIPAEWGGAANRVAVTPDARTLIGCGSHIVAADLGADDAPYRIDRPGTEPIESLQLGVLDGVPFLVAVDEAGRLLVGAVRGRRLHEVGRTRDRGYNVSIADDGRRVAVGTSKGDVEIWALDAGSLDGAVARRTQILAGPGPDTYVGFTADGAGVVLGRLDGHVERWDLATSTMRWRVRAHATFLTQLAVADDVVVTGGRDEQLRIWDLTSGALRVDEPLGRPVFSLALTPDRKRLAVGDFSHPTVVYDLDRLVARRAPGGREDVPIAVQFTDADHVASVDLTGRLTALDVVTGRTSFVQQLAHDVLPALQVDRAGRRVVAVGLDQNVYVADDLGRAAARRAGSFTTALLALSVQAGGGDRVLTRTVEGRLLEMDLATASVARTVDARSGASSNVGLSSVSSADGLYALHVENGQFEVRRWPDHRVVSTIAAPPAIYDFVAVTRDGRSMFAGAAQQGVRRFDLRTGASTVLLPPSPERCGAADDEGTRIAIGTQTGEARVVDVATGAVRALVGHRGPVYGIALDPGGARVATAAFDGTVRVFDAATGAPAWFGTALSSSTPRAFTQRGWEAPGGAPIRPPPQEAFRAWIETTRTRAVLSPDEGSACAIGEGVVSRWSLRDDAESFHVTLADVDDVAAANGACAFGGPAGVVLFDAQGARAATFPPPARRVAFDADALLVLGGDDVAATTIDGRELWRRRAGPSPTTALRIDDELFVGHADGLIRALSLAAPNAPARITMERSGELPVTTLRRGPAGTIVAGYANGDVLVWDAATGKRVAGRRAQGAVVDVRVDGARVYALTDAGDGAMLDAAPLTQSRCEVLQAIWRATPSVFADGDVVRRGAPGDHACAER